MSFIENPTFTGRNSNVLSTTKPTTFDNSVALSQLSVAASTRSRIPIKFLVIALFGLPVVEQIHFRQTSPRVFVLRCQALCENYHRKRTPVKFRFQTEHSDISPLCCSLPSSEFGSAALCSVQDGDGDEETQVRECNVRCPFKASMQLLIASPTRYHRPCACPRGIASESRPIHPGHRPDQTQQKEEDGNLIQ